MHVLFWSELFWPYIGGVEVLAAKLLPALREIGYEFLVVTSHDYLDLPDEAIYEGIPIRRLPFRRAVARGDIESLARTRQQVMNLKRLFAPDLIHVNSIGPSSVFHLQTASVHPAPLLMTLHLNVLPDQAIAADTLQARLISAADWIASCSATVLDQLQRVRPEVAARSSVIQNGFEVPTLPPTPLPFDPPRLLCLGRLVPKKGFDLALTALASIIDRFPNVRLIVAGDGPAKAELEQQTLALGLGHAVEFTGWVEPDEVASLINTATMMVMPSRREGLPVVAIQAALMARPIVATPVAGIPEVVVHEQTGLLVEEENNQALAEAIALLLTHPERARHMGQAARRHGMEKFSWDQHVNAYDALYRKLMIGAKG